MIEILAPRYRDRTVLIARYKIMPGQDAKIKIKQGAYKGAYKVPAEVIAKSPVESIKTKAGKVIQMRAVSLDQLVREEEYA